MKKTTLYNLVINLLNEHIVQVDIDSEFYINPEDYKRSIGNIITIVNDYAYISMSPPKCFPFGNFIHLVFFFHNRNYFIRLQVNIEYRNRGNKYSINAIEAVYRNKEQPVLPALVSDTSDDWYIPYPEDIPSICREE